MYNIRIMRLSAVVALALVSAGAGRLAAADGIVVVQKRTVKGGEPTLERVWLDRDRLRMESKAGRASVIMIADMRRQVIWSVIEEQRQYTEMTKADIDALAASLRRGGVPTPPRSAFRKTGVDRVGAWACDVYEVTRDGKRTGELCTVESGVLGITRADLQVVNLLAALIPADMAPYGNEGFLVPGSGGSGYAGIPIREISMYSSTSQETKELVEISRQSIPESMFQVPAGYTKTAARGIRVP